MATGPSGQQQAFSSSRFEWVIDETTSRGCILFGDLRGGRLASGTLSEANFSVSGFDIEEVSYRARSSIFEVEITIDATPEELTSATPNVTYRGNANLRGSDGRSVPAHTIQTVNECPPIFTVTMTQPNRMKAVASERLRRLSSSTAISNLVTVRRSLPTQSGHFTITGPSQWSLSSDRRTLNFVFADNFVTGSYRVTINNPDEDGNRRSDYYQVSYTAPAPAQTQTIRFVATTQSQMVNNSQPIAIAVKAEVLINGAWVQREMAGSISATQWYITGVNTISSVAFQGTQGTNTRHVILYLTPPSIPPPGLTNTAFLASGGYSPPRSGGLTVNGNTVTLLTTFTATDGVAPIIANPRFLGTNVIVLDTSEATNPKISNVTWENPTPQDQRATVSVTNPTSSTIHITLPRNTRRGETYQFTTRIPDAADNSALYRFTIATARERPFVPTFSPKFIASRTASKRVLTLTTALASIASSALAGAQGNAQGYVPPPPPPEITQYDVFSPQVIASRTSNRRTLTMPISASIISSPLRAFEYDIVQTPPATVPEVNPNNQCFVIGPYYNSAQRPRLYGWYIPGSDFYAYESDGTITNILSNGDIWTTLLVNIANVPYGAQGVPWHSPFYIRACLIERLSPPGGTRIPPGRPVPVPPPEPPDRPTFVPPILPDGDVPSVDEGFTVNVDGFGPIPVFLVPDSPVKETLIWKTRITKLYNGKEQRSSIRPIPRRTLEYNFTLFNDKENVNNSTVLQQYTGQICIIPIWSQATRILKSPTENKIEISADKTWFNINSTALFFNLKTRDTFHSSIEAISEEGTVLQVIPSLGTIRNEILGDHWRVVPTDYAYIKDDNKIDMNSTYGVSKISISSIVSKRNASHYNKLGSPITHTMHDGSIVMTHRPIILGSINNSYNASTKYLDSGTSHFLTHKNITNTKTNYSYSYRIKTPRQFLIMADLINRLQGSNRSFWLPTWRADFIPTSPTVSNTNIIFVEDNKFSDRLFQDTENAIQIQWESGRISYHTISSYDSTSLTLETPVIKGTGTIKTISRLEKHRIMNDTVKFNHQINFTDMEISAISIY